MTAERTVSVVIPVYNGERYIGEALESVLRQSAPAAQIIVVDDGSTDGSAAVAQAFANVTYCLQDNAGAAAARNRGIGYTTSEFIAFLDADDLWHPLKLERQLQAFVNRPELDIVFCHVDEFLTRDSPATQGAGPQLRKGFPAFAPSAALAKRDAFDRVGLFATDCGVGEFIDWYARAMDAGLEGLALPETLFERRIHDANQGVTKRDSYNSQYLRILKKTLDRRRAKQNL